MKRKLLILSPLIVLVVGFIAMKVLGSFKEEKPKRTPQIRPRIVNADVVVNSDVPARLSTFGTLESSQPVLLISEASGKLMQGNVKFQPAQTFKKGDLLVRIDDRQTRLQLNSTKSDFLSALTSLLPEIKISMADKYKLWESYFDAISFDKPLADLPEVNDQRLKALLARFNIYKLFFTVQDLEIRLAKHYIYAPFDGSIVSTQLRVGSTAAPGSRLAEIINLDELEVEIQLPAQDITWIAEGDIVDLSNSDGSIHWQGHIERIGNTINERSQSVPAYIKLDDTGVQHPYAGTFLKVLIEATSIPNSFEVPRKAVYEESYVYLVQNGTFQERAVNIAFDEGDFYIINGGLADGDTLVTELLQGVAPGMPARAILPEPSQD